MFSCLLIILVGLFFYNCAILKDKISAEDKICKGKVGMVKEIMKSTIDMEIFCEFLVKAFIPVGRR
jgi:hypothetical protein